VSASLIDNVDRVIVDRPTLKEERSLKLRRLSIVSTFLHEERLAPDPLWSKLVVQVASRNKVGEESVCRKPVLT
jgi:hypothetical protein